MTKPWEELRFLKKIEIVPAAPNGPLRGVKVETSGNIDPFDFAGVRALQIYDEDFNTHISVPYGANVVYHYDYPEDFKKLVRWHKSYSGGYDAWKYLHDGEPAEEDWNAAAQKADQAGFNW